MRGIVAAALATMALTTSTQQTFRVNVDAVRVDVLVMDGNRPVAGLSSDDFELRDWSAPAVRIGLVRRGPAQHAARTGCEWQRSWPPSGRSETGRNDGRRIAQTRGSRCGRDVRRGIDLSSDWTTDRQQVARAIERTQASGTTALHDAAYAALTLRDPQAGRLLILIFSDGDDTASWLSGQTVIDLARRSGAVIYTVGLRNAAAGKLEYLVDFQSGPQPEIPPVLPGERAKTFLTALAEQTGGKYIALERSDQLRQTFTQIVTEFRSRYLLTYIPAGVERGGWHPIEVKLKGRKDHYRPSRILR